MPSVSKKQHNFMAAIAHSPSFAKKVGISQSVGSDFVKADKGRKFAKGDNMAESKMKKGGCTKMAMGGSAGKPINPDVSQEPSKGRTLADKRKLGPKKDMDEATSSDAFRRGGNVKKMAMGGSTRGDGCAQRGKTRA